MDLFEWAETERLRTADDDPVERQVKPVVRNADGKRRAMLERLQDGPLSTYEAERLVYCGEPVHRGQAIIGALRAEGHCIKLESIAGADHYVYYGQHVVLVPVSKSMREAYYATNHWKAIALERKERDGFACQQCRAIDTIETHHWRYNLFAESVDHDLITFCRACHQSIHELMAARAVHFPRQITEELAARIEAGQ